MRSGAEYTVPSEAARAAIGQFAKIPADEPAAFVETTWQAVVRLLEREGVEWKI